MFQSNNKNKIKGIQMNLFNYEITMYLLWEIFIFFLMILHWISLRFWEIAKFWITYIYIYIQIVNFEENLKINTYMCFSNDRLSLHVQIFSQDFIPNKLLIILPVFCKCRIKVKLVRNKKRPPLKKYLFGIAPRGLWPSRRERGIF